MRTISINENNDIYIDNSGNLAISQDLEAMGNIFVNKSQTLKNEMLYSDKGIDYFNTIFSNPSYPDLFQNELTNQLEATEATISVESFEAETKDNVFKYSAKIQTEYGELYLNG